MLLKPRTINPASRLFFNIFIFVTGILTNQAFAQPGWLPQPEHITDRQGLPQAFVPSLIQDKQGFMWMATSDGLCRYDGNSFKVFQPTTDGKPGLSSSAVVDLKLAHDGKIWVLSERHIDVFDPHNETFVNFSKKAFFRKYFTQPPHDFYPDSKQRLWLNFSQGGLYSVDLKTQQIQKFQQQIDDPTSLSHNEVTGIIEDRKGIIWITTHHGLNRFDEKTSSFTHYKNDPNKSSSLPSNHLIGIFEQRDGQLLLMSMRHLTIFNTVSGEMKSFPLPALGDYPDKTRFAADSKENVYIAQFGKTYRFNQVEGIVLIPTILGTSPGNGGLYIDRSDVLWMGSTGSGIYKYNLRAGSFQTKVYKSNFNVDLLNGWLEIPDKSMPQFMPNVSPYYFRYTFDKADYLWFNTGGTPFYRFNLKNKQINPVPLPITFDNHFPYQPAPLATDPDGKVWVVYDSLAMWYDESHKNWQNFRHKFQISHPPGEAFIENTQTRLIHFVVDQHALWIITDSKGMFRVDRKTGKMIHYRYQPEDPDSISSNSLLCISSDPNDPDILWIGTFGSGLCMFNKKTQKSKRITIEHGLPNNVIYAAIPDHNGSIWLPTNQGLCRMNKKTFKTRTYTREDGLLADEFNRFHFLHLPDDRIILGGLEGITAFYPNQVSTDNFQPQVEITSVKINNNTIATGPESFSKALSVQMIRHLDLNFNQNFLRVDFAGLQYNNPKQLRYRYLLDGMDQNWVVTDRPEAIYTNLSPGNYTLKLNTSNTAGLWSPHIRTMTVSILPPWWATWWAYAVYAAMSLGIAYSLISLYIKQKESQQLKAVDEMKTRFFSNMTHEFRTPLTLIIGPAQQLKKNINNPEEKIPNTRRLDSIDRNAHQLLQLVNQLLDLSKLDANAMQVDIMQGDLKHFIQQLIHSFDSQAQDKQITVSFIATEVFDTYWFDAGKLERILYNLFSNTLKFTPAGGLIELKLDAAASGVTIEISDNGIGIPAKNLRHIFDRFYQVDDSSTRSQEGTGIGLALVKELVELQKGSISVKSEVGQGTSFNIYLPYLPVPEREVVYQNEVLSSAISISTFDKGSMPNGTASAGSGVVLLVEDNLELAAFIADSLPKHYKIHQAHNGSEALEKALLIMPDIVISDVLMPVMDGFTFCNHLKTDLRTSHIPVILLTAKASHTNRITGLSLGADDYISKPFHVDELQLRAHNLLEQQRKLRDFLQSRIIDFNARTETTSIEQADPFLEKLYSKIEEHLDDTSYGVEELTNDLNMHRMTLLRKVKAITNFPTSDLIRNYRLKRAAQILAQGNTVTETAYKVGFDNLPYFSKCFRDAYSMTPSEYIAKNKS